MIRNFDHVTIVVRDVEAAKRFFALLGFKETKSVVISGKIMEDYMGVAGIEAEHVTLALENVTPRTEVQLLRYRHPDASPIRASPSSTSSVSTIFALRSTTSTPKSPSSRPPACSCATRS